MARRHGALKSFNKLITTLPVPVIKFQKHEGMY